MQATGLSRFLVVLPVLYLAILGMAPVYTQEKPPTEKRQAEKRQAIVDEYLGFVQPLLSTHCYDCHAAGADEGGFKLDGIADLSDLMNDQETWSKVLKNVRAGVMPPTNEQKPSVEEIEKLARWVKSGPFRIDVLDVDPGRVTIHRLNRIEYQNSIFQLLGVKFNANEEFPPDAAGMGIDNIAELHTMSPLVLEKYINSAEAVLDGAFPSDASKPIVITGIDIRGDNKTNGKFISFNKPPELTYTFRNTVPGAFRLKFELEVVDLTDQEEQFIVNYLVEQETNAKEKAEKESKARTEKDTEKAVEQPDQPKQELSQGSFERTRRGGKPPEPQPQKPVREAHFVVTVQSGTAPAKIILNPRFSSKSDSYEFEVDEWWGIEPHTIKFNVVVPGSESEEQPRPFFFPKAPQPKPLPAPHVVVKSLAITQQPTVAGQQYFGGIVPEPNDAQIRNYISNGIRAFGSKAFRRPIDEQTVEVLVDEIEFAYREKQEFNDCIKPALAKLLCSPRFLFRIDRTLAGHEDQPWGDVDEYTLASRLAFFLWSGPPDDELISLAERGELRTNLDAQLSRMLANDRSQNFIDNFAGQWLQTRNVAHWAVVESAVLSREKRESLSPLLTESIRGAMQREVQLYFSYVLKADRSVLDFIDSDYTFLNKELAEYYGINGVEHSEFRRVELPDNHVRGGVITAGSTLLVTSTSNRTSPVKRGVFVLDNFLGLRPHDPPPDIPSLDASAKDITGHEPTFREMLELHRKDKLCASCHNLMDPIGLGLDSFNAMGQFRESEFGQAIDTSGRLASGEDFKGSNELKHILKSDRRADFYRCLTNKMLTYAIGRGLENYDIESVDRIVTELDQKDGRFSVLIRGIIDSSPFQRRRNATSQPSSTESN